MERQLANLTGLVQKALVQNPQGTSVNNVSQQQNLGISSQYRTGKYKNTLLSKLGIFKAFVYSFGFEKNKLAAIYYLFLSKLIYVSYFNLKCRWQ